jgi:RimJ/RimL family protein N-acetyltransferase
MSEEVSIRDVIESDFPIFYIQQSDPESRRMAAFTDEKQPDQEAFIERWKSISNRDTNIMKTILYDGQVAGNLMSYLLEGEREVGYWIGKTFWGKGIATRALKLFLDELPERPLFARAAKDNAASLRVLEKCGFIPYAEERSYANARGEEIEEVLLKLNGR